MLHGLFDALPQLLQYAARTLVYCSDFDGLMATFEMREGKEPSDFLQVSFHLLPLVSYLYYKACNHCLDSCQFPK